MFFTSYCYRNLFLFLLLHEKFFLLPRSERRFVPLSRSEAGVVYSVRCEGRVVCRMRFCDDGLNEGLSACLYLVLCWMQADIMGKDCFINPQGPRPASVRGFLRRSPWRTAALALFLLLWRSVYMSGPLWCVIESLGQCLY